MRQVAVIGSSKAKPEEEEYKIAYELGKEIAQRGRVVVCGGREGNSQVKRASPISCLLHLTSGKRWRSHSIFAHPPLWRDHKG